MLIWDIALSNHHYVRIIRNASGKIAVGLSSPGTVRGHARVLTDADIDALAALLTHEKKAGVPTGKKRRSTLPSIGGR